MPITIKDVAQKAGVSIATVSRVVNQKDIHKVGLKTQQRIGKILKDLGYYPNTMARSLKTRKTYNIGVVFFWYDQPTLSDFYLTRVLDGYLQPSNTKRGSVCQFRQLGFDRRRFSHRPTGRVKIFSGYETGFSAVCFNQLSSQ